MKYNVINWMESKKRGKKVIVQPSDEIEIVIHLNTKDDDERAFSKRLLNYLNAFIKKQNPSLVADKKQLRKNRRDFDKIKKRAALRKR